MGIVRTSQIGLLEVEFWYVTHSQNPSTEASEAPNGVGGCVTVDPKSLCGFACCEAILQDLIANSTLTTDCSRTLNHGAETEAAEHFGVNVRTVYAVWEEAVANVANGPPSMQLENHLSCCG